MGVPIVEPDKGTYNTLWAMGVARETLVSGGYYKPVGVLSKTDATAESGRGVF
ncbi:hypothetical protein ASPZODRAFT_136733 [Penicilliopsis zonata CBS 506.65]|uniref:Uncharacterized protein n=1 Tax=Penicilliopsis zonata CBS 506.65 TaxID=1073090 RepID=A0A1L9S7N7_9EURO|nr:hypothetical protein ASPZODRAFT_136733 [Penicilliopsis zonata CBS 506.65]OJJ43173.1 hypothetical protein ASPZODRAFT_136733 [Penicilliopsis zonata CBS 506.65]